VTIAFCAAGLLSLLGFAFAPWIAATAFDKPEFGEPLRWMSLSILPNALLNLQAESLKGLKRIQAAMLTQGIGVPLVGIIMVWPLAKLAGVEGVTWAYLVANLLVALFGWHLWRRAVGASDSEKPTFSFDEIWQSCTALFVQSVMNRAVLPWAPLFILGVWAEAQEIGIFGAAVRVSMLVSLLLMTANNVIAPKFAELYATDQIDVLGQTARRTALVITILVSPVFLLMIFGGKWIMALFGPEFMDGALVLAILAIGQFVNAITGSVNHLLIVTGNERIVRNTTVVTALILTASCSALIPSMGAVGAAIAAASATIGSNLIASYMVWKKLRVVTIPFVRQIL
jgi:O-antigen/teichoic acid export membrane protein